MRAVEVSGGPDSIRRRDGDDNVDERRAARLDPEGPPGLRVNWWMIDLVVQWCLVRCWSIWGQGQLRLLPTMIKSYSFLLMTVT